MKLKPSKEYLQRLSENCLILYFAAFLARLIIAREIEFEFPSFLRSTISDFLTALFIAIFISFLKNKASAYISATIGAIIFTGNIEHIQYNSSNINFFLSEYGAHSQFISGSIFSKSFFSKFLVVFLVSISIAKTIFLIKKRNFFFVFPLSVIFLIAIVFSEPKNSYSESILESNIKNIYSRYFTKKSSHSELSKKIADEINSADLSGESFLKEKPKKPNIVIIFVESLNSAILTKEIMPHLSKLARENIYYKNFIAPNKLTNNGIFSALCGQFPNILTFDVKPEVFAEGKFDITCLPKKLKQLGYKNIFLQSADLSYMNKESFAKLAGFDEIKGANHFSNNKIIGYWGVDDATLFSEAEKIANNEEEPFLLTILNTGTHPPFAGAPPKYYEYFRNAAPQVFLDAKENRRERLATYRFADKKIAEFLDSLKKSKKLDNTIIFITSDESGANAGKSIEEKIHTNLLPLVVIKPKAEQKEINDYFSLTDIAISINDLLGLEPGDFKGRSLFRTYNDERKLVFSNVFTQSAYYLEKNEITECNFLNKCTSYNILGNDLKNSAFAQKQLKKEHQNIINSFASGNDIKFSDEDVVLSIKDKEFSAPQMIIGDQKIHVKRGDKIILKLEGKSEGKITLNLKTAGSKIGDLARNMSIDENNNFDKNVSYEKTIDINEEQFFWLRLTLAESEKPLFIKSLTLNKK